MEIPKETILSLSGTFSIRTKRAQNSKILKKPSSLSHSIAMTKRYYGKIDIFDLDGRKQPAYRNGYKI